MSESQRVDPEVMAERVGDTLPPLVSRARPVTGHLGEFFLSPDNLFWRGYHECGKIFALSFFGQRAVVLLGSEYNRLFFSETERCLSIKSAYPFFTRMFSPDFYFFAGEAEYQRQRTLVLPRFESRRLAGYVEAMNLEVDAFIESLGAEGEFDLTDELGPLVMRIAARCFLGSDIASVLDRDFFEEFRRFSGGMGFFTPGWLPLPRLIRSKRARDRLRAALDAMIEQRRKHPRIPPDFLQTLAESSYADGAAVSNSTLANMVLMLTWAGHETTTGHLAWALLGLLGACDELERVRAECAGAIARGYIDFGTATRLDHLGNCLLETERLHPVAFILARTAVESFQLNDYLVPKGSFVFASPSVSHRLSAEYPRPDDYWPGRFAEGREGRAARLALIGFGGGVHRCTGVHFAYLEMRIILARLLTHFDFEPIDGVARPVRRFTTKWPESPCRVRYRRICSD
jgi:sterol 14alpha-demethylase